jgi:hypothetical protein
VENVCIYKHGLLDYYCVDGILMGHMRFRELENIVGKTSEGRSFLKLKMGITLESRF